MIIVLQCFITGVAEAGQKFKCSPMQSLDCKRFTSGYWEWCHLFLINAIGQYGYPSLFIIISPSERTFPKVRIIRIFRLCLYWSLLMKYATQLTIVHKICYTKSSALYENKMNLLVSNWKTLFHYFGKYVDYNANDNGGISCTIRICYIQLKLSKQSDRYFKL